MEFRSKIDKYFLLVIAMAILVLSFACLFPLFLDVEKEPFGILLMFSMFFLTTGFIIWTSFSISYTFQDRYLFVKAGPLNKRIPYNEMISIRPTKDILTGNRIMSSIDALALSYQSGLMGEIKISPKDKERFIEELKTRAPGIKILQ